MKKMTESDLTQVCALIGDPVSHSVSPAMHNAAFGKLGLNYVYVPLQVKVESLGEAIRGLKALNIKGFNVTIPHKVAAIQYLDELDALAENLGAVNTITNQEGYLKGYNTDAAGFLHALSANKFRPEGKKVVILGAGGAARAVSFILADRGAHLTILNRHRESAQDLANKLGGIFRMDSVALELNAQNLKRSLAEADLLVNTTSVGMSPNEGESAVPSRLLNKDLIVFDIIFNPYRTKLLKDAQKRERKSSPG
jgi:shikimate dehydrogenase